MSKIISTLVSLAVISTAVQAASGLPPFKVPDCLGVNIHFVGAETKQAGLIADAGFRVARMDFAWDSIEKTKGEYNFKPYDDLVKTLAAEGIRPYFILDYGNSLYEKVSPSTDEGRAAFARFAAAGAEHFKGKGVIWELWNEPNGGFWQPKPNVEDYVKLAKAVYPAIKAADPECILLAPATAGLDYNFLEQAFKLGLLEYIDVVSVHPYGCTKPEDAGPGYARIRQLITQYAVKGRDYYLVSGEWGFSTFSKGVSEQTQADYIVRQALSNMMNGCRINIWYDWKDDGSNPDENEHRFGTVRQNLEPKPAYLAMKTMTKELNGYSYAIRMRSYGREDDYLLLFKKDNTYRLVAWTVGEPHTAQAATYVDRVEVVSQFGERTKQNVTDGNVELHLTQSPQYVEFVGKSVQ